MPFKTRIEKNGPVAHLILDDPDAAMNGLGPDLVAELGTQFQVLKADGSVRAVVLRSGKSGGFLVGLDADELQGLSRAPDPVQEGLRAAKAGQALMNAVEELGKPVVAAIHGPALGGGCELALACTARVAAAEGVRIGLPEVQLGILPGFGGTWRLPLLVTFAHAAPAVLGSTLFDTRRALKIGLVDEGVPLEKLAAAAEALALRLADPAVAIAFAGARWKRHTRWHRLLNWGLLRYMVLDRARGLVVAKTQDRFPAPLRVVELMRGIMDSRDAYLEKEARAFGELLATQASRNLVRLFLLGQAAKKRAQEAQGFAAARVAVVGAGRMGAGIAAELVSRAKLPTQLKESDPEALAAALKGIRVRLDRAVSKGGMSPEEAAVRFGLLRPSDAGESLQSADMVLEAVPEDLAGKRAVFAELEAALPEGAVLASNSGTLSVADLAAGARCPERFVGMHFFGPGESGPLVEVVPGPRTSPQALAAALNLALKLGKTPVLVRDSPGFLVQRILLSYLLEAVQLVEEGVPPEKVEQAAQDFGMSLGPLALIGEMGPRSVVAMMGSLQNSFPGQLPVPAWVARPDFGRAFERDKKTGKMHVYYDSISGWVGRSTPDYAWADVQDRLYLAMLNPAVRALDEGLASEPGLVDFAAVYGAGFPSYKGGPLSLAELLGPAAWAARAETLAHKAPWLKPPESLGSRAGFT